MNTKKDKNRKGRNTWFADNVLGHGPALHRYLLKLSKSEADARDIEQEAYLRIYEAEKKGKIDYPRAFLFRIAYNLFVQNYRKSKNSPIEAVADFDRLSVKDMCALADEQLIARERLGALGDAIDQLPPQCRRVFVMRKVYNLSHKEISKALGISRSTIEKHVGKGLQSCREHLKRHDGEWGQDGPPEETAPKAVVAMKKVTGERK